MHSDLSSIIRYTVSNNSSHSYVELIFFYKSIELFHKTFLSQLRLIENEIAKFNIK